MLHFLAMRQAATDNQPPHHTPGAAGQDIPEWFAFPSVVEVLRDHQQHVAKQ